MNQGMAPTDYADHEFDKIERNRERIEIDNEERRQRKLLEQQMPPTGVKTTALPRKNHYYPEDIQLPKPYGQAQPFYPSAQGSTMRHIRRPEARPIET